MALKLQELSDFLVAQVAEKNPPENRRAKPNVIENTGRRIRFLASLC